MKSYLLVHGLVDHERARLAKAFVTHGTLERLIFRVHVAVVSQMILASKCFATNIARIRSLVRVRALVYEQIVGLGELALTVSANVLLALSFAARRLGGVAGGSGRGDFCPGGHLARLGLLDERFEGARQEGEAARACTVRRAVELAALEELARVSVERARERVVVVVLLEWVVHLVVVVVLTLEAGDEREAGLAVESEQALLESGRDGRRRG